MKILIAEDNDDNWDMISRRLLKRGFEVERACDGQEAVDKAVSFSPRIILMDVNLPKVDGLQAARRIRELPGGASIAIIALTAHALTGDREKALDAGCDDYHSKPLDLPTLLTQIRSLTDQPPR